MHIFEIRLRRAVMAGLLCVLGACATLPDPDASSDAPAEKDAIAREERALLAQTYIDPLTRYVVQHGKNPKRSLSVARMKAERERRCATVSERFARQSRTAVVLARFERGYRYSCPAAVDAFAASLADGDASKSAPAEPARPAGAEAAQPADRPAPVTSAAQKDNCYLLFSIKNYPDALVACQAPADAGDARAQYMLGSSARVLHRYPLAVEWTRRAVAQGLPEALHHQGLLHYRGLGLPQDLRKALSSFEEAATRGLAEGQFMAGLMHYRGEGVKRNPERAYHWLAQAARQGHAQAQFQVGVLYAGGEGVAAAPESARKWLLAAALQGVAEARLRLGRMYSGGAGIEPDYQQAYVWLSLAAADGVREALVPREAAAQRLTPAQLTDAHEQIRRAIEQRR